MKCPLCLQEMNKSQNNMFYCGTDNCSLRYIDMPKKALEEFAESYQNRLTDCKRIGNLNEELTRTHKALDVARNGLEYIFGYENVPEYVVKHIRQVLDQIKNETALNKGDDNE